MQLTTANYSLGFAVTPSDTTRVTCRAIYIGGAGNIALSIDGTTAAVTLTATPVGTILPIGLDQGRIMNTNTTATLIVALQ
jgi:uncharacterized protein YabE (DUF348 family)